MRVVRFLIAVMGMAAMVAGCTQQPVAYMVYPPGAAPYPAAGIDHVVYGTGGPYVPPRPAVAYAPPAAPSPPPSPPPGPPPSPSYVVAPAAAVPAGPGYTMAPAPIVAMPAPSVAPQTAAPVAAAKPVRVASATP
jgi:hypothetical protein